MPGRYLVYSTGGEGDIHMCLYIHTLVQYMHYVRTHMVYPTMGRYRQGHLLPNDNLLPGQIAPWTTRPMNISSLRQHANGQCPHETSCPRGVQRFVLPAVIIAVLSTWASYLNPQGEASPSRNISTGMICWSRQGPCNLGQAWFQQLYNKKLTRFRWIMTTICMAKNIWWFWFIYFNFSKS
jgi:hypothetical protein